MIPSPFVVVVIIVFRYFLVDNRITISSFKRWRWSYATVDLLKDNVSHRQDGHGQQWKMPKTTPRGGFFILMPRREDAMVVILHVHRLPGKPFNGRD